MENKSQSNTSKSKSLALQAAQRLGIVRLPRPDAGQSKTHSGFEMAPIAWRGYYPG
jgi:hypothetical protein